MGRNRFSWRRIIVHLAAAGLFIGLTKGPAIAGDNRILKITLGKPTTLSDVGYQNSSSLAVSRTGVVAAFFPRSKPTRALVYRISKDGGRTWDAEEHVCPEGMLPNANSIGLREGGVIKNIGHNIRLRAGLPLAGSLIRFTDDFSRYEIDVVPVHLPNPQLRAQEPSPHTWAGPIFDKGKMVQLPNGDVLAPMYGGFEGDAFGRVLLSKSSDQGRSWHYYATVAVGEGDRHPELPGEYGGFSEPSIALLPGGEMVCVMRTQSSHLPPDYKPLFICWSKDYGKTWTKPVPTNPHLRNIWPTLEPLDNGVLACVYGRPGFHVAFSLDKGHTWRNRVSFSDAYEPSVTGQVDMIKVGPDRLLAIGGVGGGGTKVLPITVKLVDDPMPGPFELTGRILDEKGNPISGASVESGPNRYTAEYQPIRPRKDHSVVSTDVRGRFRFKDFHRGQTVLTIEADGYAPATRHVSAQPDMGPLSITLTPGRAAHGRVVDETRNPVVGACVILDNHEKVGMHDIQPWHVHTDLSGAFHCAMAGELPAMPRVRLVRRNYTHRSWSLPLSDIEKPMVMYRSAHHEEGPSLACVRVFDPPTFEDGFDDTPWARAPVVSKFAVRAISGARNIPVQARFAYDDKTLYAVIRVIARNGLSLSDDDMLELLVSPHLIQPAGMRIACNPAGRVPGRFGWNSPYIRARAWRNSDGEWTVTTAIMWLQLGIPSPSRGTVIGLGITHVQAIDGNTSTQPSSQVGPPTVFRYGRLEMK